MKYRLSTKEHTDIKIKYFENREQQRDMTNCTCITKSIKIKHRTF